MKPYLLSEDDIILHQLPGQLHAVLDMNVVILGAVYQHEPPVRDVVSDLQHISLLLIKNILDSQHIGLI